MHNSQGFNHPLVSVTMALGLGEWSASLVVAENLNHGSHEREDPTNNGFCNPLVLGYTAIQPGCICFCGFLWPDFQVPSLACALAERKDPICILLLPSFRLRSPCGKLPARKVQLRHIMRAPVTPIMMH